MPMHQFGQVSAPIITEKEEIFNRESFALPEPRSIREIEGRLTQKGPAMLPGLLVVVL